MSGAENADHLKPGKLLPSIALPATDGTEIDLAALSGRSVVIVYPWKAFATIMRTSCGSACGSSA